MKRGVTLIELLVALLISGAIVVSLASAFASAATFETQAPRIRAAEAADRAFEETVQKLVRSAFVTADAEDTGTFFIGEVSTGDSSELGSVRSDQLIFTRLGQRVNSKVLSSTDTDFEQRNEDLGPSGGIVETSLSLVPVGDAGAQTGLFLREQAPADTDPTQGGYESVLLDRVSSVFFEFYDGTDWQGSWDTTGEERTLPLAVRISYRLEDDEEETERQIIVKLDNRVPPQPAAIIAGERP